MAYALLGEVKVAYGKEAYGIDGRVPVGRSSRLRSGINNEMVPDGVEESDPTPSSLVRILLRTLRPPRLFVNFIHDRTVIKVRNDVPPYFFICAIRHRFQAGFLAGRDVINRPKIRVEVNILIPGVS